MHCNLRELDDAPVVLGFNYESLICTSLYIFNNSVNSVGYSASIYQISATLNNLR